MEVKQKASPSQQGKILLTLSLCMVGYWLFVASNNDIYANAVVGALYELLWLPMLAAMIVVSALCIYLMVRHRDRLHWMLVAALILSVLSVFVPVFFRGM